MTPAQEIKLINRLTLAGGLALIVLGIWPAYAIGCFRLCAYPLAAILAAGWLLMLWRSQPPPLGGNLGLPLRSFVIAPVIVIITLGVLYLRIPLRIGFLISRSEFEALAQQASPPVNSQPSSGVTTLNRWIGPYHVSEWAVDPRGGVYFKTSEERDGIGPDRVSNGFAYQPNWKGSPFGASGYRFMRISGDWCTFRASDDGY